MRSYQCSDGSEVTVTDHHSGKWVSFGIVSPEGESALFMLRTAAGQTLEAFIARNADKKAKRGQNRRD